jgi:hypothetical protein
MVTRTTTFAGAFLVVVGLLGFVVPGFMGMHLSIVHNVVLLLSGALAIYFGLKGTVTMARNFCMVFGVVYGVLGLAGFVIGGPDYTVTLIPGALVLGTMDHLVHMILGALFLSVGWGSRTAVATR